MLNCIRCGVKFNWSGGTDTIGPYNGQCVNCRSQSEMIDLQREVAQGVSNRNVYRTPHYRPFTTYDSRKPACDILAWIVVLGGIIYGIICLLDWIHSLVV